MAENAALPDLKAVPPPPKIYPRLNARLRLAMWLGFLIGPLTMAYGGYAYLQVAKLRTEGEKTTGILFDSGLTQTGKGRVSYRITLDYTPPHNETTIRKDFVVPEAIYQQARQAGQYPVIYSARDPEFSIVSGDLSAEIEPLVIGIGLCLFSVGVWYYRRRQSASLDRDLQG